MKQNTEESEKRKEIQINKFKYYLDITNKEIMAFLGLAGSGSTDLGAAESKKQFAHLMKQDKSYCEHFEKRDSLLEDLKVARGSKKKSKKFLDS